ncbi:hypothetical protein S40293_08123 [Stachybotrys chartarum IBT 40293]|nr:hypothetical protein S40293_08123 [Stachybotrys chartarum IBT 40293]KFA75159.1 hypothetical protein S40288_02855 [Stachybotrys chartarum IBT 40288]
MTDSSKNRIAIKFGSSTNSASKTSRTQPPSALGKRSRPHALGGGSEDGSDDDEVDRGRHEVITGFGAEGAETKRKKTEAKEYVIERQANRDWKTEARSRRRQTNPLPGDARSQTDNDDAEKVPADEPGAVPWGLTVKEKRPVPGQDLEAIRSADNETDHINGKAAGPASPPEKTVDDEAMDALLGKVPEKKLAVIRPSEEDAFQRDLNAAGEASTLADYEAMPVEEFGAALLRGMGWNGESRGPKPKEVKRRPNRMGLGAKELQGAEDLGGWNQNGKKKSRPRLDEYRREEEKKKKEGRRHEESYKRERERERERERDGGRYRGRHDDDREHDRRRDRHRDHDRDRRR